MADKMMRTAGRTSGGVAKAILVSDNGSPIVERSWAAVDTKVFDVEIRDTNAHNTVTEGTVLDISSFPVNSLRIRNTTEKAVTIQFFNDLNNNNTTYLGVDDTEATIQLSADNKKYQVFTPQEFPFLNYLHYLKFHVKAAETPETGSVVVYHCGRR